MIYYLNKANYDVNVGKTVLRFNNDSFNDCDTLWLTAKFYPVIVEQSKLINYTAYSNILPLEVINR